MPKYQCNACAGIFDSPQNGYIYYHACPPLSVPEKVAHINAGDVPASAQDKADAAIALDPQTGDPVHDAPIIAAHNRLAAKHFDRPGEVNQNIKSTATRAPEDGPPPEIAHGKGVTQIGP